MADIQSVSGADSGAATTLLERSVRRSGFALIAWSARRSARRADARALRSVNPERKPGILDASAPEAVRAFGFPPGIFR